MNRFVRLFVLVSGVLALNALAYETTPPDWNVLTAVEEIEILSENADGTKRETTVWLAVVDNEGYIRTGNTSWYPNLERKPEIGVRISGVDYAVTAQVVTDQAVVDKVVAELNHKYGWSDTIRGWVIRSAPHIVKLVPRTA